MLRLIAQVSITPDPTGLPGGEVVQRIANGIAAFSLLACAAAIVLGAAGWALSSHTGNYHHAFAGRRAVLIGSAAALLIGMSASIVNFFFHLGGTAR